jgi:hypothetical protein
MKTTWISLTECLCRGAACLMLALPAAAAGDSLTLYHRFAVDRVGSWTTIREPSKAAAWRVGTPEGPAATAEQLATVRASRHSVVIGLLCKGADDGGTHYACQVELAIAKKAGAAPCQGWQAMSGNTLIRSDERGRPSSATAGSMPGIDGGVRVQRAYALDAGFVGLHAGCDAQSSPGRTWMLRAVSNPLAPSYVDARSGLLIRSTREPATS